MSLIDYLLIALILGSAIWVVIRSFKKGGCNCDGCPKTHNCIEKDEKPDRR